MIVQLSPDTPPVLADVDRLDRLHAESPGSLDTMMPGPLCRFDPDLQHVWLDIAAARTAGAESAGDGWVERFDAMIAYATARGWTDEDASHVRAHVEHRPD